MNNLIDLDILNNELKQTNEQINKPKDVISYNIEIEIIDKIINYLKLIASRGSFEIGEYKTVYNLNEALKKLNINKTLKIHKISKDNIELIFKIFIVCSKKGAFLIEEFNEVYDVVSYLDKVINSKTN